MQHCLFSPIIDARAVNPYVKLPCPVLAVRHLSYLIINCGESGGENGVSGHISDESHGEPVREWSKE